MKREIEKEGLAKGQEHGESQGGRKGWWGRKVVSSTADKLKKWKTNVSGDLYRNASVECCGCLIWVE